MFSVILYMLRQTGDNRAPLLLFPSFSPSYCEVSYALSYFASTVSMELQSSDPESVFASIIRINMYSLVYTSSMKERSSNTGSLDSMTSLFLQDTCIRKEFGTKRNWIQCVFYERLDLVGLLTGDLSYEWGQRLHRTKTDVYEEDGEHSERRNSVRFPVNKGDPVDVYCFHMGMMQ
jgi:hypothetical protein